MKDMQAALLYGKEDIRMERATLPEMEPQGLLIRVPDLRHLRLR